jgi:23S rRNA (guanosine2251-2'-O)-methyltransferase
MGQSTGSKDILSGRNPVREALESGNGLEKLFLQEGIDRRIAGELRALARAAGVPVQSVPVQRLERLVPGVNHQGVAAVLSTVDYLEVDDMLRKVAPDLDSVRRTKPIILVLDGIQDPHNLGAILRTAVAAGANGVILPTRGAAPVNAAVLKTSAGAARHIPIARVENVIQTLDQLKERGYWVAGADGAAEQSLWSMDWDRPLVLVIGSESSGMRPAVSKACDHRLRIPMRGPAESLNASVAAGIILFAATQCRVP